MNMSSLFRRRERHPGWLTFGGIVVALVAVVLLASCATTKSAAQQLYTCPMHPDYVSDKPGDCPVCGMRLVPMKAAAPKPAPTADAEHQHSQSAPVQPEKDIYVCPMHAEVQQDKPGKCPKCGMDLVKKAKPSEPAKKEPASQSMAPTVPGFAPVDAEQGRAQMAGVRTVTATTDSITSTVRAVGTIVLDETRVRNVTTKVPGWVEKLYVNAIGQFVRAGQPLLELYSPELLASQEEYLRARQSAGEFARSSLPEVRRGGEELAGAARRRLELFDVPAEFLRQIDQTGTAQRTITFLAPFTGYVTEKTVLEGQKVEPGMGLLTVADLSRVWVAAQLYEAEATAAQLGRLATITLPYETDVVVRGRVTLVYPTIDPESRTIKVRLEFPNPRLTLKPGMFVNVALEASHANGVVVPDSAVIDSGTRQVVFVETAPGRFEPREVQVGIRSDGKTILRAGVEPGERLAVAANFLLDSESRLRGAMTSRTEVPADAHQHEQ